MTNKERNYNDLPILKTDVFLIGAGVMSATLGMLLKKIKSDTNIVISERLPNCALESSYALNNAGTGHAGYCELNYTSLREDGTMDITKAIKVNNAFKKSLEFWDYLALFNIIPKDFIIRVPHFVFVEGEENVEFLRLRHETMQKELGFN